MFTNAIEITASYIRPVIVSKRYFDGSVETTGGTLVIVNKDGWFVSASHVFEAIPLQNIHKREYEEYERKLAELRAAKAGKKVLKKLKPNPEWITACSIWPGQSNQKLVDIAVIPEADLLLGRLEPFEPAAQGEGTTGDTTGDAGATAGYPCFKDPKEELRIGTSLCKTGYAFSELETTYDETTGGFSLDFKNLATFPLDGIFTRNIIARTPEELKRKGMEVKFIETSSPGLRGHSGAPVFDTEGRVWGIQSRTTQIPLGFSPEPVSKDAPNVTPQHQSLNVGWAIHTELICRFLTERGIEFSMA